METELDQKTKDSSADLSDGEVVDSSESSPSSVSGNQTTKDDIADGETPHSPPPAKKKKKLDRDYSEPGLYGKSLNGGGNGVSGLTGRQKKRKEKQERRRLENQKKRLQAMADKAAKSEETQLTIQEMSVLQGLVGLSQGQSLATNLPKLKTGSFRGLVSHLVLGVPVTHKELSGDLELRKNRIVVAWLSLVSEDFFSNSDNHFPKLKSLSPAQRFKIEHPGSSRFAKLGLESFLCSSTDGEPSKPPRFSSGGALPSRQSYVLTKEQLFDHGFPVPGSPNNVSSFFPIGDVSKYVKVTEWPEVEPRSVLSGGVGRVPMFAVDCEMVGTKIGSELARVSIVDETLTCIYDTLVKPENPVTDYRTRYSGIDEESLKDVSVTLTDVQENICKLLPSSCILMGHSLDNDLHALRLVHPFVIDTSCLFTPGATPTNKPGLRRLTKELLSSEIQRGSNGHDSIEDATACMQLVQHKVRSGPNCNVSFNQVTPSIITEFRAQGKNTGIVDKPGVVRLFGRGASCSYIVETDKECIEESAKIIPQCDFTFIQLHDMENFLKSSNGSETTAQEVADVLDSNIVKLVEGCPEGTLVFVVCGSSDIRLVKQLQQDDFTDLVRLKKVVLAARTGMVVAFIVT